MSSARELALETLRLEQSGRVLTATYSSPPLNFATTTFLRDLDRLTQTVDRDRSIGAVVLTGGVERRFLTHADPTELGGMVEMPHPELPMRAIEPGLRALNAALRFPGLAGAVERHGGALGKGLVWGFRWKRTILRMNRSGTVYLAAINGPAMGGGQEIALACDLRYAADTDRVLMGQIEVLAGLIPGGGGTQRLPGMLGTARALEHMLEGAPIDAHSALELGLVHRLVAEDQLLAETHATAARLARRSPTAIAALKRSVYFGTRRRSLGRGLDMELAGFLAAGSARAGRRAFSTFGAELERLDETPFLAETEAWVEGTKVDLTS
jgi:enoyl-CoA hydratase/carnithine racemase